MPTNLKLTSLLLFLTLTSLPAEEALISSDEAHYERSELLLKGSVHLGHYFAEMISDEARILKEEPTLPFSHAFLDHNVTIQTKKGASLLCDRAMLDFARLKGEALAKTHPVIYEADPIKLRGDRVTFNMARAKKKLDLEIDHLKVTQNVQINYSGDTLLLAEEAIFDKRSLDAIVTAYPLSDSGTCELYKNADHLIAKEITINLKKQKLYLQKPEGIIEDISIKTDRLEWNHLKETLKLLGQTTVEKGLLGTLTCRGEVKMRERRSGYFNQMKALGHTDVTYEQLKLTCHDTLSFDQDHLTLTAVGETTQVRYETPEVVIFADRIEISYRGSKPRSALLLGHIRLYSADETSAIKCGLCDRIDYDLEKKKLKLISLPGKRVLFWNEEKALSLSAEEIHLLSDEVIQGVGNVRFSFTTGEDLLIKKSLWKTNS